MKSATKTAAKMTMLELIDRYALGRDVERGTINQMRYTVAGLNRWAGKSVRLGELTDDLLNQWITDRITAGDGRRYVRGQRANVLTLWRFAVENDLLRRAPTRVKRVLAPPVIPEAWTADEVAVLLASTDTLTGVFTMATNLPCFDPSYHLPLAGIRRGAFFRALFLVAWHSGLRPCDIRLLRFSEIRADGQLVIVQKKTRWPLACRLPPEVLDAIQAIRQPERELVFPVSKQTLWEYVKRMATAAGLTKGSPKWFRRSSATAVEMISPGSAMAHLGHKTPGLAYKHYVDPRQVQIHKIAVPALAKVPALVRTSAPKDVELSAVRRAILDKERMSCDELHELLSYLKSLGISRKAIAARIGLSHQYVGNMARGHDTVSARTQIGLRQIFGMFAHQEGST